jgi:Domain of unknown function (DUF4335)
MPMNSSNLHTRQFLQNTCEMSIEDKKSPFPAWMKFNKPNPLRFSLSLQDPDRPELEPVQVTGDRSKLEVLQGTVDRYVKEIVAKAPIPEMGGDASKLPSRGNGEDRPIDALKVTDDEPRLETDGPSRHLFYLGSSADANAAVLSLSTLQLFDLSSVLNESVATITVTEPEESSAILTASSGAISAIQDSAIQPTDQDSAFASNSLVEPRVILPSVSDTQEPVTDEFYSLETESSILERSGSSRDRSKSSKPSLGSLNLPELPDFSQSPLTSIPLWLGLGAMATIVASSPLWMSAFKKDTVLTTQPSNVPAQVSPSSSEELPSPYQSSSPSLPSNAVPSVVVSPGSVNTSGGIPVVLNPANSNSDLFPNSQGRQATKQSTDQKTDNNSRQPAPVVKPTKDNNAAKTYTVPPTTTKKSTGAQTRSMRPPSDVNRSTNPSTGAINSRSAEVSPAGPRGTDDDKFDSLPDGGSVDIPSTVSSSRNRTAAQRRNPSNTKFGTVNGDLSVSQVPADTSKPIEQQAPVNNSNDSVQVKGVQSFFQQRWKADPNAQESLQYRVKVGQNGRVQSIEGQGNYSQRYLDKTRFLQPGYQISGSGKKDQSVFLILRQDGDVQVLSED